jgi:hypothetical protein
MMTENEFTIVGSGAEPGHHSSTAHEDNGRSRDRRSRTALAAPGLLNEVYFENLRAPRRSRFTVLYKPTR